MTLEELKKERARIDKEIKKLTGLNFDIGKARLEHHKSNTWNQFRVKIKFEDTHRRVPSYKEIFRWDENTDTGNDNIIEHVEDGIDEIIEDLNALKKELRKRWSDREPNMEV